jgi:hypothetical protein
VYVFVCVMFQVVLHGGEMREKPRDADEARQFIKGCNNLYGTGGGSKGFEPKILFKASPIH